MRRAFLLPAALLVAASVAWAAQTIQGKIMSVDRHGKTLILLDGTKLMIPPSVKVQREDLKEGVTIRATFEQKGGKNVVTSIMVHPVEQSWRFQSPGSSEGPRRATLAFGAAALSRAICLVESEAL